MPTPLRHIKLLASLSDEELLAEFKKNFDQQMLAQLYLRYTDLVYGVCMKYFKHAETSKDAVMNIYQELLTKLQLHEVENFKSWLYVVVKNHCLMQLRKEKKNITVEFTPAVMQSEDFTHLDDVLEKENELKKLEFCIEHLPEDQKQSIRLFYLENKCYNEIVDTIGCDWNKVRSLIQNGRRNLKICMEKNG
ncbi:MAG TPA: sigma-70 family RNA polymerase sigma factor [Parafilimonas sp.]|nr:sigma-70 family RNA polymerase sigma factor [Parafilimonas sp.]